MQEETHGQSTGCLQAQEPARGLRAEAKHNPGLHTECTKVQRTEGQLVKPRDSQMGSGLWDQIKFPKGLTAEVLSKKGEQNLTILCQYCEYIIFSSSHKKNTAVI